MKVHSTLGRLALRYDYTIVCENIKNIFVPIGNDMVQRQLELTSPIEYTREELFKKYSGKEKVARWMDTYTEDGQEAMAVVIED